ncbi:hypothetical protein JVU11DRAFT_88 [Chiua virens]|nr:hypothetical protein JVU11DRAFT_88 [Chiua virens]
MPTLLRARSDSDSSDYSSQCNTSDIYCCNQVTPQRDQTILEYGIDLGSLPGLPSTVGLGCTPITALGTGQGASCSASPVCCSDNSYVSASAPAEAPSESNTDGPCRMG